MAEEDQTPTRPYTVLEPRDLGDLVEELLGSKVAPEIASKAVAALREEQFEVYQSRGTFQARQVGHALPTGGKGRVRRRRVRHEHDRRGLRAPQDPAGEAGGEVHRLDRMTGTMLFDALDHAIARVEEHTGEALEVRLGVYDLTVEEVRALIAERWDRYAADYPRCCRRPRTSCSPARSSRRC
jgi:hypothetical protein